MQFCMLEAACVPAILGLMVSGMHGPHDRLTELLCALFASPVLSPSSLMQLMPSLRGCLTVGAELWSLTFH